MSNFAKVAGTVALALMGAAGLLMSLCGGVFTFSALATREMRGVLMLSLPSLACGVGLAWLAWRKLRGRSGARSGG